MGAIALTNIVNGVEDQKRFVEATLTFSDDYATGGDTVAVSGLPLTRVQSLWQASSDVGYSLELAGTETAPKVILNADDGEVTAASDNEAVAVTVRIYGR